MLPFKCRTVKGNLFTSLSLEELLQLSPILKGDYLIVLGMIDFQVGVFVRRPALREVQTVCYMQYLLCFLGGTVAIGGLHEVFDTVGLNKCTGFGRVEARMTV